jgi:hypothetical protein
VSGGPAPVGHGARQGGEGEAQGQLVVAGGEHLPGAECQAAGIGEVAGGERGLGGLALGIGLDGTSPGDDPGPRRGESENKGDGGGDPGAGGDAPGRGLAGGGSGGLGLEPAPLGQGCGFGTAPLLGLAGAAGGEIVRLGPRCRGEAPLLDERFHGLEPGAAVIEPVHLPPVCVPAGRRTAKHLAQPQPVAVLLEPGHEPGPGAEQCLVRHFQRLATGGIPAGDQQAGVDEALQQRQCCCRQLVAERPAADDLAVLVAAHEAADEDVAERGQGRGVGLEGLDQAVGGAPDRALEPAERAVEGEVEDTAPALPMHLVEGEGEERQGVGGGRIVDQPLTRPGPMARPATSAGPSMISGRRRRGSGSMVRVA